MTDVVKELLKIRRLIADLNDHVEKVRLMIIKEELEEEKKANKEFFDACLDHYKEEGLDDKRAREAAMKHYKTALEELNRVR